MSEYSSVKLLEFLTYLGDKGIMNLATVQARKASVNTFFSILEPDELEDIRKLDMEAVSQRFQNLKGTQFKPESIKVYRSRVGSAIADFKRWKADPGNFKVVGITKPILAKTKDTKPNGNTAMVAASHIENQSSSGVDFPVPIRQNVIVKIVGLPTDLTKAEATRIANVIHALATMGDEE